MCPAYARKTQFSVHLSGEGSLDDRLLDVSVFIRRMKMVNGNTGMCILRQAAWHIIDATTTFRSTIQYRKKIHRPQLLHYYCITILVSIYRRCSHNITQMEKSIRAFILAIKDTLIHINSISDSVPKCHSTGLVLITSSTQHNSIFSRDIVPFSFHFRYLRFLSFRKSVRKTK